MSERLSVAAARRIALAAQGFADPPHTPPTLRTLRRTVARTGVLQIDSVNVLQRAHYMPLYARMGPYDTDLLRRASEQAPRQLVEYWAHVATYMPVELWPLMQHRMAQHRDHTRWWRSVDRTLSATLREAIRTDGPATARELDDGAPRSRDHWGWNWSATKDALEYLFFCGELAVAGRNSAFERIYDLPERVLPAAVVNAPTPTPAEAHLELIRRAAMSHGIGTAKCLADYYRMSVADTRAALQVLVERGEVLPVEVVGWTNAAYLHRDAKRPRSIAARTLLSPFDPVVWERNRAQGLFDFFYRIEIYTPAAQRVHGYYVLPFLLGDRLVGRVDLKADRPAGTLWVQGAFAEAHTPAEEIAPELAAELERLAGWLGLAHIDVAPNGELAGPLARAVGM